MGELCKCHPAFHRVAQQGQAARVDVRVSTDLSYLVSAGKFGLYPAGSFFLNLKTLLDDLVGGTRVHAFPSQGVEQAHA